MTVVKSNYELTHNELYETEYWCTQKLIKHFPVEGLTVHEPCAGNHKIADVLMLAGAAVITSDIEQYNRPHMFLHDYLNALPIQTDCVITNPPYGAQNRLAAKFARLALERCSGLVAMLLTAKFDSGSTRHDLFRNSKRFAAKIVLTDRVKWFGDGGGTDDHAWFVWTAPHDRRPVLIYEGRDN